MPYYYKQAQDHPDHMDKKTTNRFVKKIPLRHVLIVSFVIQVVLVTGLAGYLSFRNGQQAVNEAALRKSEERFRLLFANAPDATFLADIKTGTILNANAAAARLLQKPTMEKLYPKERYPFLYEEG